MPSLFRRKDSGDVWHARYRDARGRIRRKSTKVRDRARAEQIAREWERPWRLRNEGLLTPQDALSLEQDELPLSEHIAAYKAQLEAAGRTARTVSDYGFRLDWLIAATGADKISDLSLAAVSEALARLHQTGKAARTINYHGQVARAFLGWCVRTGRLLTNPLEHLGKANEARDKRRERRPLTDAEVKRLYAVADPKGRGLFYRLAFMAGLRLGELKRLQWRDVDLDARVLIVRQGKAAREDAVPISSELHAALSEAGPGLPAARVLRTIVTNATRRKDYDDAGIPNKDDRGLYADLHSARMTLHHRLVRAGVSPQVCQALLRHSDYRTTEQHYSRLGDFRNDQGFAPLRDAVAAMDTEPEENRDANDG